MVEGFSQELQPPPRVLQKKEPGAGGGGGLALIPFCTAPHPLSPSWPPHPSTPCSYLTAPSLQAAATRGPRPGLSNSHTARDMYLQRTYNCQVEPCTAPPHAPAQQGTSPGLWVHFDHPVPTAWSVPVLI